MKLFSIVERINTRSGETSELAGEAAVPSDTPPDTPRAGSTFWRKWYGAFKEVLPTYLGVHLAFVTVSFFAFIFLTKDFSGDQPRVFMLWRIWHRFDAAYYMNIAAHGYTDPWRTAFFPFYSILERGMMIFTGGNSFVAGLIISDVACLVMLAVLYQLVSEDFDEERARRAVLYLSVFPQAFFFAAAYTESLFLCLILLSFYNMRHQHWWLAGIFGFFASLTRSAGIFLLLPFAYEYVRACQFNLKNIRFSILSAALIPAAIGIFSFYCYQRFGDWLAFSHAEFHWGRELMAPWWAIQHSIQAVRSSNLLSYQSLHNLTDLLPTLFILVLIILGIVGPWRFSRAHLSYLLYAGVVYLFIQMVPLNWATYPVQSFGRYMLMVFPAFIVLAGLGKYRLVHLSYLFVAGSALCCLLTLYLIGRVVI
jgi:Gpi18-like mannosyltransferase